ncbi:hypothetical protein [Streptomyces sp. NPDC001508]|uniref:hypothetical protein n=1 Tax=Streptomyces sp. NPDC001508 TaxID=3154656 RepID=UPI003334A51F
MARRARKSPSPTTPLVKQPLRIGTLDAVGVVGELRQLHEDAEDPSVERMPADDEVYGALLYAEKHAGALRRLPPERQKAAALKRVVLWEYLRERAEVHQARAVADARGTGAEWAELAPVLAVKASSAAYNKAKRLRAAALADEAPRDAEPLRRTPEAVIAAENRIARHKQAEQRAQEAVRRRHHILVPVAQRLLDHRDGLVPDEDAEYWLDEMAEVLPSCTTATQMTSLSRYLSAAVRALSRREQRTTLPVATTDEARIALAAAVALVMEQT